MKSNISPAQITQPLVVAARPSGLNVSGFRSETQAYYFRLKAASVSTTLARLEILDELFTELETASLLTVVTYLLVYNLTPGFTGCNIPAVKPSEVGNATLTNLVAGDWSTGGLAGGSGRFVDTGFNPRTWIASVNASTMFQYLDADYSHTENYFGGNESGVHHMQYGWATSSGTTYSAIGSAATAITTGVIAQSKLHLITRRSSTQVETFRDTTSTGTSSVANTDLLPNISLQSMRMNHAGPGFGMTGGRCASFGVLNSGLTSSQVTALNSALTTFHDALKAL